MPFFTAASRAEFHQQLQVALSDSLSEELLPQVCRFAEHFFFIVPLKELCQRRMADLVGATLSAWRRLEQFDPHGLQIHVFNPNYEKHGWQSTHTAIQLLHRDVPFLVESVRMDLARRGSNIHTLQNTVIRVRRDAQGRLLELLPRGDEREDSHVEALVFLEVDRCASHTELTELEHSLKSMMADIRLTVADFSAMKARTHELVTILEQSPSPIAAEELAEIRDFFAWLRADHFTFLGYEEFRVAKETSSGGGGQVSYDLQSLLGQSKRLRQQGAEVQVDPRAVDYLQQPLLLSFAKSATPSRVHRPAYPDYVSIRLLNAQGQVERECRFMGLFTASVYTQSVRQIPFIRHKVAEIEQRAGLDYSLGKELARVLEVLPRDELFQASAAVLCDTALSIVQIQERSQLRLFMRIDPYARFCYCLTYIPRDNYSTETRLKIQQVLMERLKASSFEFWTYFSESLLIRVQFILSIDPLNPPQIDPEALEHEVALACRSWRDDYADLVVEWLGEARGSTALASFQKGFPAGYREHFSPYSAVVDLQHLLELGPDKPLVMSFYQPMVTGENRLHCKIYHGDISLPLSEVLPVLENLGLSVLGEIPHQLEREDGEVFWIRDFSFTYARGLEIDLLEINEPLQDAFIHIINGRVENDAFNRLILTAGLSWREVTLLRAYARYMKQIRLGFDHSYIAAALINHGPIARELVRLFKTRFYLARKLTAEDLALKQHKLEQAILGSLDEVAVLSEDRILRRFMELIMATLRTNFYQPNAQDQFKDYISFKFDPQAIPELPRPLPCYEIFVYSPRVEGVHLRGGKVARGGLRWSDREEDYRTEVLGLVKAQQVKNAVIVPQGAKGGFVPRRLPVGSSRDAVQAEAIACYRIFISGLLDLTDNLKEGRVLPPPQVMRYDGDDPYLVVAADKGTATFSDIANDIAKEYGFWLGDAFASGGSAGYDHKKMGITARGAWVSVQRHFRERGINVQQDSISVIGIGDMSGDVFGNGMLLSDRLRLVAAFNHMHIFIDPDPDPALSFAERKRLFALPRSSWTDYDTRLITAGGGIFPRTAKSIDITPEMQSCFAIKAERLTPAELIHALLKAPVDLLWNGGIGTYVKSRLETHAEVGDKTNDGVRINGDELHASVVGEGGNLGLTQLARVEYCLRGGACNTDFIDNAGGVDCSDHEVNIKILLNGVMAEGDMTLKQRNQLLAEMTEDVADLVLDNNYKQVQALSLAQRWSKERPGEYMRLTAHLESAGRLDRALEFFPTEDVLVERLTRNQGLSRPELSVLISYCKIDLQEALLASSVPDDDYYVREVHEGFPARLGEHYADALQQHRLKREIIATQIANDLVNHMGITFAHRLHESTGCSVANVAATYVVVRDIFHLPHWFHQVELLDYRISAQLQISLMDELVRLGRRATRWFLRNRRNNLNACHDVAHFGPKVSALGLKLNELLEGAARRHWQDRYQLYVEAGVPELLARIVAGTTHLYTLLPIVEAAEEIGQPPERVAAAYFLVGGALELNWYLGQVTKLPVDNSWQALAREGFRDDLDAQQRAITVSVLASLNEAEDLEVRLHDWIAQRPRLVGRWRELLASLATAGAEDYAMHAVASRELQSLASSSAEEA